MKDYVFSLKPVLTVFDLLPGKLKRKLISVLRLNARPCDRPIQGAVIVPIQNHAYLAVYWKAVDLGRGPGASLYVHENEVLRFDCFGEGTGHYHMNVNQTAHFRGRGVDRMVFRERTVQEQIERSYFELTVNSRYFLKRNRSRRIRRFELDSEKLRAAAEQMKAKMTEYGGDGSLGLKPREPERIEA